jgi:hypothetical protein
MELGNGLSLAAPPTKLRRLLIIGVNWFISDAML